MFSVSIFVGVDKCIKKAYTKKAFLKSIRFHPPQKPDSCHIKVLINSRRLNPADTNSLSAGPTPISTSCRRRWTSEVTFIKTTSPHQIVVTLLAHLHRAIIKTHFCSCVNLFQSPETKKRSDLNKEKVWLEQKPSQYDWYLTYNIMNNLKNNLKEMVKVHRVIQGRH